MANLELAVVLEADLLVDTGAAGRQPGVRSGTSDNSRQLLYRSGELYLDLRLGRPAGAPGGRLIGQLLNGTSTEPLRDLAVEVEYGDGTLVTTRSDRRGEFLLACDRKGAATIGVELEHQARLEVPLPDDLFGGEET